MPWWGIVLIIVAIVIAIALAAWIARRRIRSRELRERFGPEYERTMRARGGRREAEAELTERASRRDRLEIRALEPAASARYAHDWSTVQARFVDEPAGAVADADRLITTVMRERGYPMDDFEGQADVISVDHSQVVQDYRQGHTIFVAQERGEASTEDLRQAMVHYRALFADLIETDREPVGEGR